MTVAPPPQELLMVQQRMGRLLLNAETAGVLDFDDRWQELRETDDALKDYPRDRLQVYESMLRYSVVETLGSIFPQTKRFLDRKWIATAEGYRRTYPNSSFQLYRAVAHFPEFLAQAPTDFLQEKVSAYPFLSDLARYEWSEIEVQNAPDSLPSDRLASGRVSPHLSILDAPLAAMPETVADLNRYQPCWNPIRKIVRFQYPVPALLEILKQAGESIPENLSLPRQETDILFYRDPDTLKPRFFQLNPLTVKLLQTDSTGLTGRELLLKVQENEPVLANISEDFLLAEGFKLFKQCDEARVLSGWSLKP